MNLKNILSNILFAIFGPPNDVERIELNLQRLADDAEAAADSKSRKLERLRQQISELEAEEEAAMEDRLRLRQLANRAYDLAADGAAFAQVNLNIPDGDNTATRDW
jgi:hypothetical protein